MSVPATDPDCPECYGAGTVTARGTETHEIDVCPVCTPLVYHDPHGFRDVDEGDGPTHDEYAIRTEERAAEIVERIGDARARLERVKAATAEKVAKYAAEAERIESFWSPWLEEYYRQNPPRRGKSINLDTGTIGTRKKPGGLRVQDRGAVEAWARKCCAAALIVREVVSVSKKALDDHAEKTGEIPDGCAIVDDSETFYIRGPK